MSAKKAERKQPEAAEDIAALIAKVDAYQSFRRGKRGDEIEGGDPERFVYYTIALRAPDGELKKPHADTRIRTILKRRGYSPAPDGVTCSTVVDAEIWQCPVEVYEHLFQQERRKNHANPVWLSTQIGRATPSVGFVDPTLIPRGVVPGGEAGDRIRALQDKVRQLTEVGS